LGAVFCLEFLLHKKYKIDNIILNNPKKESFMKIVLPEFLTRKHSWKVVLVLPLVLFLVSIAAAAVLTYIGNDLRFGPFR